MDEIAEMERIRSRNQAKKQEPKKPITTEEAKKKNPIIRTGKKCPKCGMPLKAIHIAALGLNIPVECDCVVKEKKAEDKRMEVIEHERYIKRIFAESGLPKRQRGCTFENFELRPGTEKALKWCKQYVKRFEDIRGTGNGLMLVGNTGSGKTHLVSAMANVLLSEGVRVVFWNVPNLYYSVRASYKHDGEADIVSPCMDAGLLILDDIGAEKPSEWTESTAYNIINSRASDMLPTIITSNMPLEGLEESKVLDARAVSRISQMCSQVSVTAQDYRRQK